MDKFIDHVTDFAIRGISFTSRKRGWAFDNVKVFEVSAKPLLALLTVVPRISALKFPALQVKQLSRRSTEEVVFGKLSPYVAENLVSELY